MKKLFKEVDLEIYEIEIEMSINNSMQRGVTDVYDTNEWGLLG